MSDIKETERLVIGSGLAWRSAFGVGHSNGERRLALRFADVYFRVERRGAEHALGVEIFISVKSGPRLLGLEQRCGGCGGCSDWTVFGGA